MSQTRVQMTGLDELRQALRELPDHLAIQAGEIVGRAADETGRVLQANYPVKTGNLQKGVKVEHDTSRQQARATVRSTSRHAYLFEFGTKAPRTTLSGANRGKMPVAPENQRLIPLAIRARRGMVRQLIALVESAGLEVSGD